MPIPSALLEKIENLTVRQIVEKLNDDQDGFDLVLDEEQIERLNRVFPIDADAGNLKAKVWIELVAMEVISVSEVYKRVSLEETANFSKKMPTVYPNETHNEAEKRNQVATQLVSYPRLILQSELRRSGFNYFLMQDAFNQNKFLKNFQLLEGKDVINLFVKLILLDAWQYLDSSVPQISITTTKLGEVFTTITVSGFEVARDNQQVRVKVPGVAVACFKKTEQGLQLYCLGSTTSVLLSRFENKDIDFEELAKPIPCQDQKEVWLSKRCMSLVADEEVDNVTQKNTEYKNTPTKKLLIENYKQAHAAYLQAFDSADITRAEQKLALAHCNLVLDFGRWLFLESQNISQNGAFFITQADVEPIIQILRQQFVDLAKNTLQLNNEWLEEKGFCKAVGNSRKNTKFERDYDRDKENWDFYREGKKLDTEGFADDVLKQLSPEVDVVRCLTYCLYQKGLIDETRLLVVLNKIFYGPQGDAPTFLVNNRQATVTFLSPYKFEIIFQIHATVSALNMFADVGSAQQKMNACLPPIATEIKLVVDCENKKNPQVEIFLELASVKPASLRQSYLFSNEVLNLKKLAIPEIDFLAPFGLEMALIFNASGADQDLYKMDLENKGTRIFNALTWFSFIKNPDSLAKKVKAIVEVAYELTTEEAWINAARQMIHLSKEQIQDPRYIALKKVGYGILFAILRVNLAKGIFPRDLIMNWYLYDSKLQLEIEGKAFEVNLYYQAFLQWIEKKYSQDLWQQFKELESKVSSTTFDIKNIVNQLMLYVHQSHIYPTNTFNEKIVEIFGLNFLNSEEYQKLQEALKKEISLQENFAEAVFIRLQDLTQEMPKLHAALKEEGNKNKILYFLKSVSKKSAETILQELCEGKIALSSLFFDEYVGGVVKEFSAKNLRQNLLLLPVIKHFSNLKKMLEEIDADLLMQCFSKKETLSQILERILGRSSSKLNVEAQKESLFLQELKKNLLSFFKTNNFLAAHDALIDNFCYLNVSELRLGSRVRLNEEWLNNIETLFEKFPFDQKQKIQQEVLGKKLYQKLLKAFEIKYFPEFSKVLQKNKVIIERRMIDWYVNYQVKNEQYLVSQLLDLSAFLEGMRNNDQRQILLEPTNHLLGLGEVLRNGEIDKLMPLLREWLVNANTKLLSTSPIYELAVIQIQILVELINDLGNPNISEQVRVQKQKEVNYLRWQLLQAVDIFELDYLKPLSECNDSSQLNTWINTHPYIDDVNAFFAECTAFDARLAVIGRANHLLGVNNPILIDELQFARRGNERRLVMMETMADYSQLLIFLVKQKEQVIASINLALGVCSQEDFEFYQAVLTTPVQLHRNASSSYEIQNVQHAVSQLFSLSLQDSRKLAEKIYGNRLRLELIRLLESNPNDQINKTILDIVKTNALERLASINGALALLRPENLQAILEELHDEAKDVGQLCSQLEKLLSPSIVAVNSDLVKKLFDINNMPLQTACKIKKELLEIAVKHNLPILKSILEASNAELITNLKTCFKEKIEAQQIFDSLVYANVTEREAVIQKWLGASAASNDQLQHELAIEKARMDLLNKVIDFLVQNSLIESGDRYVVQNVLIECINVDAVREQKLANLHMSEAGQLVVMGAIRLAKLANSKYQDLIKEINQHPAFINILQKIGSAKSWEVNEDAYAFEKVLATEVLAEFSIPLWTRKILLNNSVSVTKAELEELGLNGIQEEDYSLRRCLREFSRGYFIEGSDEVNTALMLNNKPFILKLPEEWISKEKHGAEEVISGLGSNNKPEAKKIEKFGGIQTNCIQQLRDFLRESLSGADDELICYFAYYFSTSLCFSYFISEKLLYEGIDINLVDSNKSIKVNVSDNLEHIDCEVTYHVVQKCCSPYENGSVNGEKSDSVSCDLTISAQITKSALNLTDLTITAYSPNLKAFLPKPSAAEMTHQQFGMMVYLLSRTRLKVLQNALKEASLGQLSNRIEKLDPNPFFPVICIAETQFLSAERLKALITALLEQLAVARNQEATKVALVKFLKHLVEDPEVDAEKILKQEQKCYRKLRAEARCALLKRKLNNDNIGKLLEKEAFQIYFEDSTAKELGNKLAYRLVPMQDESKRWDSMREVVVKEVALAQVGDREPSEKERNELQEIKNNFSDEVAEILWLNLLTKEQRENHEKIIELVDQLKEAHLECLADRIIGTVREQSFGLAAYTKLLECLDHHKFKTENFSEQIKNYKAALSKESSLTGKALKEAIRSAVTEFISGLFEEGADSELLKECVSQIELSGRDNKVTCKQLIAENNALGFDGYLESAEIQLQPALRKLLELLREDISCYWSSFPDVKKLERFNADILYAENAEEYQKIFRKYFAKNDDSILLPDAYKADKAENSKEFSELVEEARRIDRYRELLARLDIQAQPKLLSILKSPEIALKIKAYCMAEEHAVFAESLDDLNLVLAAISANEATYQTAVCKGLANFFGLGADIQAILQLLKEDQINDLLQEAKIAAIGIKHYQAFIARADVCAQPELLKRLKYPSFALLLKQYWQVEANNPPDNLAVLNVSLAKAEQASNVRRALVGNLVGNEDALAEHREDELFGVCDEGRGYFALVEEARVILLQQSVNNQKINVALDEVVKAKKGEPFLTAVITQLSTEIVVNIDSDKQLNQKWKEMVASLLDIPLNKISDEILSFFTQGQKRYLQLIQRERCADRLAIVEFLVKESAAFIHYFETHEVEDFRDAVAAELFKMGIDHIYDPKNPEERREKIRDAICVITHEAYLPLTGLNNFTEAALNQFWNDDDWLTPAECVLLDFVQAADLNRSNTFADLLKSENIWSFFWSNPAVFQTYFEHSTVKELRDRVAYWLVPTRDESERWNSMKEVVVKEVDLFQKGDRELSPKEIGELPERIGKSFSDEVAKTLWEHLLTAKQRNNHEKIISLVEQLKLAGLKFLADRIMGKAGEQSFGLAAYTKLLECLDHHKFKTENFSEQIENYKAALSKESSLTGEALKEAIRSAVTKFIDGLFEEGADSELLKECVGRIELGGRDNKITCKQLIAENNALGFADYVENPEVKLQPALRKLLEALRTDIICYWPNFPNVAELEAFYEEIFFAEDADECQKIFQKYFAKNSEDVLLPKSYFAEKSPELSELVIEAERILLVIPERAAKIQARRELTEDLISKTEIPKRKVQLEQDDLETLVSEIEQQHINVLINGVRQNIVQYVEASYQKVDAEQQKLNESIKTNLSKLEGESSVLAYQAAGEVRSALEKRREKLKEVCAEVQAFLGRSKECERQLQVMLQPKLATLQMRLHQQNTVLSKVVENYQKLIQETDIQLRRVSDRYDQMKSDKVTKQPSVVSFAGSFFKEIKYSNPVQYINEIDAAKHQNVSELKATKAPYFPLELKDSNAVFVRYASEKAIAVVRRQDRFDLRVEECPAKPRGFCTKAFDPRHAYYAYVYQVADQMIKHSDVLYNEGRVADIKINQGKNLEFCKDLYVVLMARKLERLQLQARNVFQLTFDGAMKHLCSEVPSLNRSAEKLIKSSLYQLPEAKSLEGSTAETIATLKRTTLKT